MKRTLPSKLYKYQPYTTQTLENLKKRQIWFSKPSRFNDPFDCGIQYQLSELTTEEWKALYDWYVKDIDEKEEYEAKYITKGQV